MEARVFDRQRLASRHVTVGPERALQDSVEGMRDLRLDQATLEARKGDRNARPGNDTSGAIWKFAQGVGPARNGAVSHSGGAAEVVSYAGL